MSENKEITTKKTMEVSQPHQFVVNLGGKNYINKGGKSWKLTEFANKHKGIKSCVINHIKFANEDGEFLKELYFSLEKEERQAMITERGGLHAEMFSSPKGEAIAQCTIIFGDGLKACEKSIASKANVAMSSIHNFLDNMAATRAFNRCVSFLTAEGFLDVNIIENDFEYTPEDLSGDNLGDLPFRLTDGGTESGEMDTEGNAVPGGNKGASTGHNNSGVSASTNNEPMDGSIQEINNCKKRMAKQMKKLNLSENDLRNISTDIFNMQLEELDINQLLQLEIELDNMITDREKILTEGEVLTSEEAEIIVEDEEYPETLK